VHTFIKWHTVNAKQGNSADKLSYSVFLNEIVEQLWPNINVAGSQMIKEIAEPMFKTMLPGPLKTLHFTKIDLGTVPLKLNGVLVSKTTTEGIKLDMNVDWDGECDIKLDADMIPELVPLPKLCTASAICVIIADYE
jgi:Ca2+-dependent lipid-binding protein